MGSYFNNHSHTHYSNIRLLDCISKPKDLIDKAIELGLSGIAITDHECLGSWIEVNQYAKKIKEKYPNFTIGLGNEIYLTDTRERNQKYYHFLLIAKDEIGAVALKELSSIAWKNSYIDRLMERVPLLKSELKEVMKKYQGHVIATSACIGSEIGSSILALTKAEKNQEQAEIDFYYEKIVNYIQFCLDIFKDDFYIECAPASSNDQIIVNKRLYKIAKSFNVKMCVGTDAHYLSKEDRFVHKAYLNSKNGEREIDTFYEFTYLMSEQEVKELLSFSFNNETIDWIIACSNEIKNKITFYDLEKKQSIPQVQVTDYPKLNFRNELYPTLKELFSSDNVQERYWVNECYNALKAKHFNNDKFYQYLAQLETEADVIKFIGNKLETCLFAYFNTFKHYIDLFWECGSIVGPGRGSATGYLSNYLLGITQLDPIEWDLKWWRFLNKERAELPDIDIDLAPSRRPKIFEAIRKERGELGLVQVCTYGTEGTKNCILSACRGYRSEEFPDGIDVDQAQYLSSLIPQERGFLWSLHDVVYGNPDLERKPVSSFVSAINAYPGLLDIMLRIEGLINKRSSHASGVIFYDENPYKTAAFMKTPSCDLVTQWDLHAQEYAGDTKYDLLVTEISDKIIQCLNLLQKDKIIEQGNLRTIYNKYLHPDVLDTKDEKIWRHLAAGDILDVFQFNEGSGLAIAKKVKPTDIRSMTASNAMMRLMSEKGKESQQDRYVRIKTVGLQVFDKEMQDHHLPIDIIEKLHKYCDPYYGCTPLQEQMMEILMEVVGFTLAEANDARKVVAKKQMSRIPELKEKFYKKLSDSNVADYIWELAVAPQLGYAFSVNHSTPYSFVGVQAIVLSTKFNAIYWNTACLIVNSGSLEDNSTEEIVDIYAPEADDLQNGVTFEDLPDRSGKIRRTVSTDYTKIAKAIGAIRSKNIKVSLTSINNSDLGFKPDVKNNQILYGLKGINRIGSDLINEIISHRPYSSWQEFYQKVKPNKAAMFSLIKGGAFDEFQSREKTMVEFIWQTCDKKNNITLQNMASLISYDMLPEECAMAKRVYYFNKYLKTELKQGENYKLDTRAIDFLAEIGYENDGISISAKEWDKKGYQPYMDIIRDWIAANKEKILDELNTKIFMEDWEKYATGNLSSWEMESLCFYYHDHELKDVNMRKYGLSNFYSMPEEPVIDKTFKKGDKIIPIYKLTKICGTCIAKNKNKGLVYLLTIDGVVTVRFSKEYFSMFDRQISERQSDGKKKVLEKSWFNKGNMIVVQGMRRGDEFVAKKYASSLGHTLYHIDKITNNGTDIILRHDRAKGELEEDGI